MEYDTVIIGAGIGGLATASMLAQRGQKVMVIDRHNIPGGYATNFTRKGFTFDASLHSFDGVMAGANSFECIKDCGVADKVEFLPHRKLYRYISGEIDLSVKERDLDSYKHQLAELFPGEKDNIDRLFAEAQKAYHHISGLLYGSPPFWMRIIATPFLFSRLLKYEHYTVHKFFSRFTQNERLKSVLAAQWTYYGLPPQELAFPYFSYPFIDYLKHGGYSIKGGSQMLSDALHDVIERHGGRVVLSSPVTKIHVANKKIDGVTSKKTGFVKARRVVANISPYAVTELTGREHFTQEYLEKLDQARLSTSAFQVYLGLDCKLSELGVSDDEYVMFMAPDPDIPSQFRAMMAGEIAGDRSGWSLNFFSNVDPGMAPPGKSTLGIFTLLGNEGWQGLSKSEYRKKKQALIAVLIQKAETVLPGLSKHIEVCEGGSPATLTKFTANPMGAIYGFAQSVPQSGLFRRFPQRYPIKGLYHVGAWTFPGAGYIGTLLSARVLVDRYFSSYLPGFGLRRLLRFRSRKAPVRQTA
jgi:phytoene dehydrogenase-like protein